MMRTQCKLWSCSMNTNINASVAQTPSLPRRTTLNKFINNLVWRKITMTGNSNTVYQDFRIRTPDFFIHWRPPQNIFFSQRLFTMKSNHQRVCLLYRLGSVPRGPTGLGSQGLTSGSAVLLMVSCSTTKPFREEMSSNAESGRPTRR